MNGPGRRTAGAHADARVVIVGGGPAGTSLALFLLHRAPELRGRVVVIEKARYPRDKYCAGAVGGRADMRLDRIGVKVDVPSVQIDGMSVVTSAGQTAGSAGNIGRVVRRIEYDHRLSDLARDAGAVVLEETKYEQHHTTSDGVTIETSRGTLRADILVGADGVGSAVRRRLGLGSGRFRAQVIEIDTEPVGGDPERNILHFDLSDPSLVGYFWDFPTLVRGEALMCRGVYELTSGVDDGGAPGEGQGPSERPSLGDRFAARLAKQGLTLSKYKVKRFAERGFELHAPFSAPRVLLVGEAAGIDPITGEGIAQAVEYADAASEYLIPRLAEGRLDFADWAAHVRAARIGFDLGTRERIVGLCYGAHRGEMERFLVRTPSLIEASLLAFRGTKVPRNILFRLGLSGAALLVKLAISGAA